MIYTINESYNVKQNVFLCIGLVELKLIDIQIVLSGYCLIDRIFILGLNIHS